MPRRIHTLSPQEAANLFSTYLKNVNTTTRKSFTDLVQPVLDEYAEADPTFAVKLFYPITMTYHCDDCGYHVENKVDAVDASGNLRHFVHHKHLKPENQ